MSCELRSETDRNFSYNGLTVRVSSTDSSHLTWLEEFLSPHFEVRDGSVFDCRVVLTADTQRYENIRGRGTQPDGIQIDCFALDSSVVRLPLWMSSSDEQIIFDEKFRVFYVISGNRPDFSILTHDNNMRARTPLMRVVREFAMNHAHRSGCLVIHGSAFVVGGRGVVIAGPKRAGKTTLLIHVLRQAGAQYLSNDRVVVSCEETGPTMRGMPTIVTVRQQTLEMFPLLYRRLLATSYHSRLTLSETTQRTLQSARPGDDGRFNLSPAQFCHLLQTSLVAQGQVQALVFPGVTGKSGSIELEQLPAKAAAARLADSLFGGPSGRITSDVFTLYGSGSCPDQATLESLCRRVTSRVRCFECRLGEEAYQNEASATTFLRQVLE